MDQLGLVGAVKQQVEKFGEEVEVLASFSVSGEMDLDPLSQVTVFRIVQESLSNIQKHAKASLVEVTLQGTGSGLEMTIKDNGDGFNTNYVGSRIIGKGTGLLNMQERAEMVDGTLFIQSSPGNGCLLALHIPSKKVEVGTHSNSAS